MCSILGKGVFNEKKLKGNVRAKNRKLFVINSSFKQNNRSVTLFFLAFISSSSTFL